ncbi:MAG: 1-phosphofructokinase family hexose kinase [Mesorhizobium sp.]|uniref:1-phosphofructokinase family hexose kinase n=1 Tax=Mesorhizobium sp. TaxID=1871066 RepID=UPI000FE74335|nr:1-phosphofructokinase family hexose kinase [Mesorhizobium sp.]RWM04380.1 MAG: 1-phosphofructokinase family hexose kinase [Mesorhizobium sp.]TIO50141.1 MAG: 1-phosphofructokinase family hexose kinase [Mesorhizobium sp.]TIO57279.1 MAG: 1-phosphofructokinase family hexose kinase [Mesorhizobium sp.]TJV61811.1 MAG: 1-phosphofructokinase family hexose kinase [Mesorhizobium sp.]
MSVARPAPILTITLNPAVDVSSETDTVRPVRKVRTSNVRYDPGGGGINVARVITALGGEAEAYFLAGGETGSLLTRLLRAEGIASHLVPIEGQTRISFMVRERSTGLEYRFVPEGPPVQPQELEPCLDAVASHKGQYVIASGSLPTSAPPDVYARMAKLAAARGAKFVLDSSGKGLDTTLKQSPLFLVKPSRGELEQFVGRKLDEAGVGQAASDIVASGAAELVAITMGVDGALLASARGVLRVPAIHVRVRSALGAGDSFLGAMVWALSEGRSPEEAFRLGVAAGAAAVMKPGFELCRREEVLALNATALSAGGESQTR